MLKMKELIELTGEAKSTILYYVKENLLPEPKKPKANLHLYSESCVDIIKFIKYLQGLNFTISEIKELFSATPINKDSSLLMMVKALELATINKGAKLLDEQKFIQLADISADELNRLVERGYILKREDGFGTKELEIVQIIKNAKELGLDEKLIEIYITSAKEIAKKELQVWQEVFSHKSQDTIKEYELLFDLMLKLKPYIYNAHSIEQYYKAKGEK